MRIFHIVEPTAWTQAVDAGEYLPAGFEADGFVHFSFPGQVERTANALYRNVADLIVVEIESDDVPSKLVVEDSYGSGEEFPHVYGPIPTSALVASHELSRGPAGEWLFAVAD